MDKSINLALIGASGVVGQKILQLLEKKNIKINRYYHLFVEDELDKLVPLDAAIMNKYSEYNNWLMELEKL